jgi:hypothetical protein
LIIDLPFELKSARGELTAATVDQASDEAVAT